MRRLVTVASLATIALAVGSIVAFGSSDVTEPTTVRVIEHATSDTVIDTGAAGDTTGDLLTFHNRIFNSANTRQVGRDQGECIRISPRAGTWECTWITRLPGGALTVEGPFFDSRDSVLAITGGTGNYANARGSMSLISRKGGTEYVFLFNVLP
jgi:allene oxide cyclase